MQLHAIAIAHYDDHFLLLRVAGQFRTTVMGLGAASTLWLTKKRRPSRLGT